MRRALRTTLFTSAIAAALFVPTFPAGAAAKPPVSGTVTCDLAGTLTFNPGLAHTGVTEPGTKNIRTKLKGTATNCTSDGLVNSKWPIVGAAVTMSGVIPADATCWDLPYAPDFWSEEKTKLSVKWFGTNDRGKRVGLPANSGLLVYDSYEVYDPEGVRVTGWELGTDIVPEQKPFADQFFTLTLGFDNLARAFGECYFGDKNLEELTFSAAKGSRLTVAP